MIEHMLLCKNLINENVCEVIWPQSKFQKDFVNCLQSSDTYILVIINSLAHVLLNIVCMLHFIEKD